MMRMTHPRLRPQTLRSVITRLVAYPVTAGCLLVALIGFTNPEIIRSGEVVNGRPVVVEQMAR